MKPNQLIRPLSAAEDLFWRPDVVCPLNSVGSLLIDGELSTERLQAALNKVQQRHPLLQARVKLRWNRPRFISGAPAIPLERIALAPEELRNFEIQQAEVPIDTATGPLIRVTCIDLGTGKLALVFAVHHAIFDGRSIIVLVQDLFKYYLQPDLAVEAQPVKPAFSAALPREARWLQGYRNFKRLKSVIDADLAGITGDLKVDNSTPIEQRHKVFDFLFIDREFTRALLNRTRKEKTTLHAIMSVVLASVIAKDLDMAAAKFAVVTPTDVSAGLAIKFREDIMLATSAVTCSLNVESGENPWEAARRFRANLHLHTREKQHLLFGPMLMKIYALMAWKMSLGKDGAVRLVHAFNKASGFALSYTTMGDIGIASDQGEFKVTRVYSMPGYTTNTPLISLSSIFDGELVWAFGGFKEQIGEERLRRLMQACQEKLAAVVAS